MKTKHIFINFSLLIAVITSYAQQVNIYNQYGNTKIPLNNAGSFLHSDGEINFIGRQQWMGLDGAPQSYHLAGSLPLGKKGIMGGLNMSYETISVERMSEITAFAGKAVQLNTNHYLAVSLGIGISHYSGRYSELDAQDPVFGQDVKNTEGLMALSVLFYNPDKYYVGFSAPRVAFSKLGLSADNQRDLYNPYHFTAGALISINEDFDIKPAGLFAWSKDVGFNADLSAIFFLKKTIGLGANIRTYGDMAGIVQFYAKRLNLGYSYQFNTSTQPLKRGLNNNTHEISIGYRFGKTNISLL